MFRAVCFDCDSTLSAVEGIDLLAQRAGVRAAIAPLTRAAMDGTLRLEEVYRRRLELIRPDRAAVDWLAEQYRTGCVAGAREVIAKLGREGRAVHIVSGGVWQAVAAFAGSLDVPPERVHAVRLEFDAAGGYAGYEASSPLAGSGGKAAVCGRIARDAGRTVLVGDGVTDLEAAAAGVPVIGFGGVARREAVIKGAAVYIDAPSLHPVLDAIHTLERSATEGGFAPCGRD
jgi:phosphoserine phosphatase